MTGFGGIAPDLGPSVRTVLTNPSTRPGLFLPGQLNVLAGAIDVPVESVAVGLVTRVEPADGEREYVQVEFCRTAVAGAFALPAGQHRVASFSLAVPWETPVTVVNGSRPLNLWMGLRTEVVVSPTITQGDLKPVYVHPLPVHERILATLVQLGFEVRQVGLQAGRLPGVRQTLPFHQKIGFWVAPLYGGPFSELELTFITDAREVEVIFWLDRRLALAGAAHTSISRFRVEHSVADRMDWVALMDSWLRHALARHAALAFGYQPRAGAGRSARVPASPSTTPTSAKPALTDPSATGPASRNFEGGSPPRGGNDGTGGDTAGASSA